MSAPTPQVPILEASNLDKKFGGIHAVRAVSMHVMPGEVVALAGDNGAGKSTLIKMISGVYQPDGGEIRYAGERVDHLTPREIRERGIETIYQDLALADNLDAGTNLFLGRGEIKKLLFIPYLDRRTMRGEAEKALLALGITVRNLDAPVRTLSGGQRQALAIGRAVYWQARLLIMDEPTAALGVPEQREVLALIHRLKQSGVGIIFISHNLHDIFAVSDRIIVLDRGRKAGERLASETDGDEVVKLMMGGAG
jgi:simple sugar transport system ATP-binding protein